MIGKFIKGKSLQGATCSGIVLDKVLTLQTIEVRQGLEKQAVPIALDAYLVRDENNHIHTIAPAFIFQVQEVVEAPGFAWDHHPEHA